MRLSESIIKNIKESAYSLNTEGSGLIDTAYIQDTGGRNLILFGKVKGEDLWYSKEVGNREVFFYDADPRYMFDPTEEEFEETGGDYYDWVKKHQVKKIDPKKIKIVVRDSSKIEPLA